MAKQELLATIRDRYRASPKREKSRILDEFIAVTGHHRKHGIRLLGQSGNDWEQQPAVKRSRRIYDAAVGEALIVVWEAADRICGKRLQAALPHLAGGAPWPPGSGPSGAPTTADGQRRHLGPIHGAPWPPGSGPSGAPTTADGQRRHLGPIAPADQDTGGPPAQTKEAAVAGPQYTGADLRPSLHPRFRRTFADWNAPPPGHLEIDLVVHHGGSWWGSMIHSLVATPISAPAGLQRCRCWPGSNPWWWQDWRPSDDSCPSPSKASTRTNAEWTTTACSSTRR